MAEYLVDGKLTDEGRELAGQLFNRQCDRVPCAFCSHQDPKTKGPGGQGCVAEGIDIGGGEVNDLLTAYMGRKPGFEALDSLSPKI